MKTEDTPARKAIRRQWYYLLAWIVFASFWGGWLSWQVIETRNEARDALTQISAVQGGDRAGALRGCERANARTEALQLLLDDAGVVAEIPPTLDCEQFLDETRGVEAE